MITECTDCGKTTEPDELYFPNEFYHPEDLVCEDCYNEIMAEQADEDNE